MFVLYAPELDLSSCGDSAKRAAENLQEAVRLFVGECEKMGALECVAFRLCSHANSQSSLRSPLRLP